MIMAYAELEGKTLEVYAFVAQEGRPVGTRDVTRGVRLSSPSVAHRHLLKLESLGLLEKNEYGDFLLKQKVSVNGYVWIGRNLVPKFIFYSFFFLGALSAEIGIFALSFLFNSLILETSFFFLIGMTILAMILFLIEGLKLHRKIQNKSVSKNDTT